MDEISLLLKLEQYKLAIVKAIEDLDYITCDCNSGIIAKELKEALAKAIK